MTKIVHGQHGEHLDIQLDSFVSSRATIFHLLRVQPVPHLVPGLRGLRAHPQRGEITDLSELPSGNLTYQ